MTNWFYYDANGVKIGPVDNEGMKRLAGIGAVSPDTVIEADSGRKSVAGKIQGLIFSQTPAANLESKPVVKETERPSLFQLVRDRLKNPVASAIIGFVAGVICMFVFDWIYCSRETYRKEIAKSYVEESLREFYGKHVPPGMFDDAFAKAQDASKKAPKINVPGSIQPGEPKPKEQDPRLKQFEVQSWKPFFENRGFLKKLSLETTVKNGTDKAVKDFAFLVTAKKKGRTVPIDEGKRVLFFPKAGIEPNETITVAGLGDNIYGVANENLDDIEFTVSLDSITFFDDERVNNE